MHVHRILRISLRICCVMSRNAHLRIPLFRHGSLRTSCNFIRRPITPNPFRSTNPLSLALLTSLSRLFVHHPWITSCVRGHNRTRFPTFLSMGAAVPVTNEANQTIRHIHSRVRCNTLRRLDREKERERERVGSAYYKRDSPYLCELAGLALSHVLLVLLPAVGSYMVR